MARPTRGGCGQAAIPAAYLTYSRSTDPHVDVPANSGVSVPWYHFKTTDQTVFGTATGPPTPLVVTNLAGDTLIAVLKAGVYEIGVSQTWIADGLRHGVDLALPGGGYQVAQISPAQIFLTFSPTNNGYVPWTQTTWQQDLPNQWLTVLGLNKDPTNADGLFFCEVVIFYLGPGGTTTQVFG